MTRTAFLKAVTRWETAVIEAAVQAQPELVQVTDTRGRTPLHLAASVSAEKLGCEQEAAILVVEALLSAGASVNAVQDLPDSGETFPATPLWYAIARGRNTPLAAWFLQHGADATHCLWAAIWEDDAELLTLLLETQPSTESRFHGETPLLYACKLGRWEMVRILDEYGAASAVTDARGATPRDYAKRRGAPKDVLSIL